MSRAAKCGIFDDQSRGHRAVTQRHFIWMIAGAAVWPLAVRGQQRAQIRRVGVLYILGEDDSEAQARHLLFQQSMREMGWAIEQNLRLDLRLAGGNPAVVRRYASELVALRPDALLAVGSATVAALQLE